LLSGSFFHPDMIDLRIRTTNLFEPLFCQTKLPQALPYSANVWVGPPTLAGEARRPLSPSELPVQSSSIQPCRSGSTGISSGSPSDKISMGNLERLHEIHRNEAGQRIDRDLNVEEKLVYALFRADLCHYHYLRADCKKASTDCPYNHKHPRNLSSRAYDAVWSLSRQNPCRRSNRDGICEDRQCIFGHSPH